jgi:hypothetical protein
MEASSILELALIRPSHNRTYLHERGSPQPLGLVRAGLRNRSRDWLTLS